MHVNLLPKRFRMQLLLRAQLRRWSVIWAICLASAIALNGGRFWQVDDLRSRRDALDRRSLPAVQTQQQIARTSRQIAALFDQAEATETIQPGDHSLPLLGLLADSTRRTEGNIQIMRLTVQSTPSRPTSGAASQRPAGAAAAAAPTSSMSIQGIATDDRRLSQFVTSLRQFNVFETVDLRSSSRIAPASDRGREFQLECRY